MLVDAVLRSLKFRFCGLEKRSVPVLRLDRSLMVNEQELVLGKVHSSTVEAHWKHFSLDVPRG
eukprot:9405189-Prorocentrum_lima.AAC.1